MKENSSKLLDSRDECAACVETLIGLSRQTIYLICARFDPALYNHRHIYDHIAELVTKNRKTEVRLIAHDTRVASRDGHYLIQLAQKFPTFVQIRTTVTPPDRKFSENWFIIDNRSFMRIRNPLRYEGYFEIDNRLECQPYIEQFIEIWDASELDQNTRRLSI
ncbi:MAG: hypothetical protein O6703_02655 [Gammaproteobacteria bacterium]|nr:hypothetical protein [Gammaproteobacteria bacterium]